MSNYPTAITNLRRALDEAGATMPKNVAAALDDYDTITTEAANITPPTGHELGDAIAAAILAGTHPADDPTVTRLVITQAVSGQVGGALQTAAREAAEHRVRAALHAAHDTLADALHAAGESVGHALTEAHAVLGDLDLDDTETVARQGPDATRAWADAREAVARLRMIDLGCIALAALTSTDSTLIGAGSTLRYAEPDLDLLDAVGKKAGPWEIVRAGHAIDLADAHTIRERQGEVLTMRDERERRHAAALAARRPNYAR